MSKGGDTFKERLKKRLRIALLRDDFHRLHNENAALLAEIRRNHLETAKREALLFNKILELHARLDRLDCAPIRANNPPTGHDVVAQILEEHTAGRDDRGRAL